MVKLGTVVVVPVSVPAPQPARTASIAASKNGVDNLEIFCWKNEFCTRVPLCLRIPRNDKAAVRDNDTITF